MSEGLRALASVTSAEEQRRARAHDEALVTETRARAALEDARTRYREAEAALADAANDPVATAAERAMNEARRARLRDRLRVARDVEASACASLERASRAVELARAALGSAHGEHRVVEVALERAAVSTRAAKSRKDEDEADELARTRRG